MVVNCFCGGPTVRITVGITMMMLVIVGGAEATKIIKDDATGGDCDSFGTWNTVTKTCTMTADIIETIQIDSNDTTLDGNGYSISGSNTGNGIYLSGRSGVTIKNMNIGQFYTGVYILNSNNNYLIGNTASSNYQGIVLSGSSSNVLSGNIANSVTLYGIYLEHSNSNALSSNIANLNGDVGIYLYYSDGNMLSGNNANLNKLYSGNGIYIQYSKSNNLSGNNANLNDGNGIILYSSSSNRLSENIANSNNGAGIFVYSSSNSNKLKGNNASSNKYGIDLRLTNSNALSGNIVSSNRVSGIYLSGSNNNIYDNNLNNSINLIISGGSNTWNTAKISGTNIIEASIWVGISGLIQTAQASARHARMQIKMGFVMFIVPLVVTILTPCHLLGIQRVQKHNPFSYSNLYANRLRCT